jgi:hypothetical protein
MATHRIESVLPLGSLGLGIPELSCWLYRGSVNVHARSAEMSYEELARLDCSRVAEVESHRAVGLLVNIGVDMEHDHASRSGSPGDRCALHEAHVGHFVTRYDGADTTLLKLLGYGKGEIAHKGRFVDTVA